MNPVTSGPRVNESLETNLEGVFACGNVLHVHDLVDFVSEEAGTAGRKAAVYVKECAKASVTGSTKDSVTGSTEASVGDSTKDNRGDGTSDNTTGRADHRRGREIRLQPAEGVRYIVPERINVAPVHIGDVIVADVAGTGADVIATKNVGRSADI